MTDELRVVLKVLNGLNYLKLCVDHDYPCGEGIPVDIVILPDMVVDVDGAVISQLNKDINKENYANKHDLIAAAEVGSRAGRILSILAHLQDLDSEEYHLHYITKTGNIGEAVLKNRLIDNLIANKLQPLSFPLLVPSDKTMFAVLGRSDYVKASRQVLKVDKDHLLTRDELRRQFYNPGKTIFNANSIYFAADSIKQFDELIDYVLSGEMDQNISSDSIRNHGRCIIIDLSAIHNEETGEPVTGIPESGKLLDGLTEFVNKNQHHSSYTHFIFIIKDKDDVVDFERQGKEYFKKLQLRNKNDILFIYNDEKMGWYNGRDCKTEKLAWQPESIHSRERPYEREAFFSGIVLYCAFSSAWNTIVKPKRYTQPDLEENWTSELLPNPFIEKNKDTSLLFDEAVLLGKALLNLWTKHKHDEIPDKRSLVYYNYDTSHTSPINWKIIDSSEIIKELAAAGPIDWYIGVSILTKRFLADDFKGKSETYLKEFAENLFDHQNCNDLLHHPSESEWKKNDTKVLNIASSEIIKPLFSLQVLKRLSIKPFNNIFPLVKENLAYLSDLDGTLILSSKLREICLKKAFIAILTDSEMCHECSNKTKCSPSVFNDFPLLCERIAPVNEIQQIEHPSKRLSKTDFLDRIIFFYHVCIYKKSKDWEKILKNYPYYLHGNLPKDFRQVWNHPLSYSIFICVLKLLIDLTDPYFNSDSTPISILLNSINNKNNAWFHTFPEDIGKAVEYFENKLPAWLKNSFWEEKRERNDEIMEELKNFYIEIASIELKYKRTFEAAIKEYWNVEFKPLAQTRELINILKNVFGAKLYIATEGHHDTQVLKIKTVKLNDFFPESRIMSTSAAAMAQEDLQRIDDEIKKREKKIDRFDGKIEGTKEVEDDFHHKGVSNTIIGSIFSDKFNFYNEQIGDFKTETRYLTDIYKKQWEAFNEKKEGIIYSLILSSIMVNPESPLLGFTNIKNIELSFPEKSKTSQPMIFTMIGDREKNDIKPLLEQWRNKKNMILTIRLLTFDHMTEDVYWESSDSPNASYVAWSQLQVLLFSFCKQGWSKKITYSDLPPILNERLVKKNNNNLSLAEDVFNAMAWGNDQPGSPFTLLNYLITQSTFRDPEIPTLPFIDIILLKLEGSRSTNINHFFLCWEIIENLVSFIKNRGNDVELLTGRISDTICRQIRILPPGKKINLQVLDIIDEIKDTCPPPGYIRGIRFHGADLQEEQKLERLKTKWIDKWPLP